MNRQRKRLLGFLVAIVLIVATYTLLYRWGMATFEGEQRSLIHSLEVVIETFTTTGYGADAPWTSPQMNAVLIAMQLTGVVIVFMTLPLFVVPWVENAMETTPPTVAEDVSNHVIICEYTPRGETLVRELEAQDVDYVVVQPDRDRARSLYEDGTSVVHGDPESTDALERAGIERATTVVADSTDETNASIVLSVRECHSTVRTISFVEDSSLADYIRYAGADQVFSPRHLLGRGLANKVTSSVTADLGETVEIGSDFEIVELSIQQGSEVAGERLSGSGIRERTGASIIGAWLEGEFVVSPAPDTLLDENTVLLVAGRESQLERLKAMTLSEERSHARKNVIVAGYGEVGSTVSRELAANDIDHVVVDIEEKEGVSVVGSVTDEETLRTAGIDRASAIILALSDDTTATFAALILRELDPHVEVVARANESESVGKMYRAGVDYVLALETVSGRMLASTILGEDVMALDRQIEIVRTEAESFAGRSLGDAAIRSRTGCTVIAVERNGDVETDLGADYVIAADDQLIVAGVDEDISQFYALAE